MNNKPIYWMTISLQVLEHLGINLYSNIPAVLSEVVANAYDADANEVTINVENDKITIKDDGNGMSLTDINGRFLHVGYQKRNESNEGSLSPKFKRQVMGRKGIGKLSLFSIAENIEIHTIKNGQKNGFILNRKDIKDSIAESSKSVENSNPYYPKPVDKSSFEIQKGTRITISQFDKNVNRTEHYLRRRLARRFSIIDADPQQKEDYFVVKVNNKNISIEDREYFNKIQFLWLIDNEKDIYSSRFSTIKQVKQLSGNVISLESQKNEFKISGWIGTVEKPSDLGDTDSKVSNNKISVVCRGKLWQEDILKSLNESGIYATYLIGEVKADFLDKTEEADIATSNRQSIKEDDNRYQSLIAHLQDLVRDIKKVWDDMRKTDKKEKVIKTIEINYPAVLEWFNTLKGDNQNKAKDLFATIESFHFDDSDEKEKKKELYKQGIIAFEKLRLKDELSKLEKIQSVTDLQLANIFANIDDIEANNYYDIAKDRVDVIKVFDKILDDNEKEKLIQTHLFGNLWLLNPSWERATKGSEKMEKTFKTEFNKVIESFTEDEKKARYDIKYRTSSNKHIIIELKRNHPSYKVDLDVLTKQVRKYRDSLKKIFETIGELNPHYEIIVVLGDLLKENRKDINEQLSIYNSRLIYYNELVEQSLQSYQTYLDRNKAIGKIRDLIEKI